MKTLIFITLLTLGIATARAQDTSALEQAREKFDANDTLMTKVFKETCTELDKAQTAALQEKQQAWVKFREARSEAIAQSGSGTKNDSPKLSVEYWKAMAGYTEERVDFLLAYSGKNITKGVNGEYKDAYDGDLELVESKDGLDFTLSVVRGLDAHTGQISGTAQRKGDKAYFKEEIDPAEKKKPCELVFTFIDGHIVKIEEKTPDPDAEAGVHYDGDYYKRAGGTGD